MVSTLDKGLCLLGCVWGCWVPIVRIIVCWGPYWGSFTISQRETTDERRVPWGVDLGKFAATISVGCTAKSTLESCPAHFKT